MAVSRKKNLVPAFNLVPVVEQFLHDRQIECVCGYERSLYVGTSDGLVVYYQVDEKVTPFGKKIYQCHMKVKKQLDGDRRKPVQQLTVVPHHRKLLVLLDGTLLLLDMDKLELSDSKERITKVLCYCTTEGRSRDPLEVVVSPLRKKQLMVYALSGDRLQHVRDYPLAEQAVAMAKDGPCVCVALSGGTHNGDYRYILVNLDEGGKITELLSYEPSAYPLVKRTAKNEFLINAGDFGVIASVHGMSNRPPVAWGHSPPVATAYVFPYVVVWSRSTGSVLVYSLMDQRCVQEIPFPHCRYLGQLHGKVYAALDNSVYTLLPVPLKDQVDQLLDKHLVDEAIILAETIAAVDATKHSSKAEQFINSVKEKAAFILFCSGKFSQAETLYIESNTDPRKVISLFEGVLPPGSTFEGDVKITAQQLDAVEGKFSLEEAKKFLIRYIKNVRNSPLALGRREDIDTSLIKLLAERRSESLVSYLKNHELHLDVQDTQLALEQHRCYHALGLLLCHTEQVTKALKLWIRICDGHLNDDLFPGFSFIVDFLCQLSDVSVLMQHANWVLDHNQEEGVRIFTGRQTRTERQDDLLRPANVLEFLASYPIATRLYLEYLITDQHTKEEFFHTKLGSMYLDDVLAVDKLNEPEQYKRARSKLKSFLSDSAYYRPSVLLHRVQDTELYHECVVLYGRMEEHDKALMLLVHKLKDYGGAEEYCADHTQGRSRIYRQNLYHMLLSVYLRPTDSAHDPLIAPALQLINTQGAEFNAAQVLQLLPSRWNISTVHEFLLRSIRSTNTTHKMSRIENSLARGENLQTRLELIKLHGDPVVISDTKVCPVCQLPFNEAAFVRYPNGIVTHLRCARNKTICPITGTWFGDK